MGVVSSPQFSHLFHVMTHIKKKKITIVEWNVVKNQRGFRFQKRLLIAGADPPQGAGHPSHPGGGVQPRQMVGKSHPPSKEA